MKCLIIEDNDFFRGHVCRALSDEFPSATLYDFDRGLPAIDLCKKVPGMTAALVDLGLPDIDGVEVIRQLRAMRESMPILVLSINANETDVLKAIQAGASGYLIKGEPAISISAGLNSVLSGEFPLSPKLARMILSLPHREPSGDCEPLTPREVVTLQILAEGKSYKEIGDMMNVSLATVQSNIRRIYKKLDVHNQVQAVNRAKDYNYL